MSQMRITMAATGLNTMHAMRGIVNIPDCTFADRLIKTRPAAAGIKLGIRIKKRRTTTNTTVYPLFLIIEQAAGKRVLSSRFLCDIALNLCQLSGCIPLLSVPDIAESLSLLCRVSQNTE